MGSARGYAGRVCVCPKTARRRSPIRAKTSQERRPPTLQPRSTGAPKPGRGARVVHVPPRGVTVRFFVRVLVKSATEHQCVPRHSHLRYYMSLTVEANALGHPQASAVTPLRRPDSASTSLPPKSSTPVPRRLLSCAWTGSTSASPPRWQRDACSSAAPRPPERPPPLGRTRRRPRPAPRGMRRCEER